MKNLLQLQEVGLFNYLRYTMLVLASFVFVTTLNAVTITWDGGGDGVNWDDPLNWDTDTEPTATDEVIILANNSVVIRQSGEVATMIAIQTGATLTIQAGATFTSNDSPIKGIDLQANASLINRGTITILNMSMTSGNDGEGIRLDASGAKVDNYGTIIINGAGGSSGEGIELDEGTTLTNHASGTITISNTDNEVICADGTVVNDGIITLNTGAENNDGLEIDNDQSFTNNGTLTINANALTSGEPLDVAGTLTNNGLINIKGTPPDEAIFLNDEGTDPLLINELCGIINIDNNLIEINADGSITNKGIITTGFAGANDNEGTFTNDGEIRTTNGTFSIAPNAVVGSGKIVAGNLPATQSLCFVPVEPIPTLSQWGLLILGLLVMNLSVFFVQRRELI